MRHFYNGAICVLFIALVQTIAISQCPTQAPPDCDCDYRVEEIEVCFANETYLAKVTMCTQYATTTIIDNPCTVGPNDSCKFPVDAITWIRDICVPQNLKNQGLLAIYNAIIRGTNLCCNNFIGATIPNCQTGKDCVTSAFAYCHLVMLPKCLNKNYLTGCYDYCGNGCNNYCVVDRRYCMQTPTTCCMYGRLVCEYQDSLPCNQNCNTYFDQCDLLTYSTTLCCD